MESEDKIKKICIVSLSLISLILILSGVLYALWPSYDIDSTSYNYKCENCQKVIIEKEKISNLNCLNSEKISNINIGYNVYDDGIKVSENGIPTNFIYMFINYKNSLGKTERLKAYREIHDSNFFWEENTVAKIIFEDNKINLITSKKSLMMEKDFYLRILEELSIKSCNNIQDMENKINIEKQKIENIKAWKKA